MTPSLLTKRWLFLLPKMTKNLVLHIFSYIPALVAFKLGMLIVHVSLLMHVIFIDVLIQNGEAVRCQILCMQNDFLSWLIWLSVSKKPKAWCNTWCYVMTIDMTKTNHKSPTAHHFSNILYLLNIFTKCNDIDMLLKLIYFHLWSMFFFAMSHVQHIKTVLKKVDRDCVMTWLVISLFLVFRCWTQHIWYLTVYHWL